MRTIWTRAAIVAVLTALGCALIAGSAAAHDGAHASVIGGRTATIQEYPWLAFIEGNVTAEGDFPFSCTGTVIAPRVVLTAGHCVEDIELETLSPAYGYRVATGVTSNRRIPASHISHVTRALVYPGFRPRTDHGDAGLLVLSRPTAAPALAMAGPGDSSLLDPGTPIEIAGWGITDYRTERSPPRLQAAGLLVQSADRCRRGPTEPHEPFSPALQFCALDKPDFRSSGCYGDSGGPAIAHRTDGTPVVLGIVNSGGFECQPRRPNLYARVDRVSTWASEWIAAVESGAPAPPLAQLPAPVMNRFEARFLALRVLHTDFGRRPRAAIESLSLDCRPAARSRYRCRLRWERGRDRYFGQIVVFFTTHTGPVTWNDSYTIRRGSKRCLSGPNPRSCPLKTREHRAGKPKRV